MQRLKPSSANTPQASPAERRRQLEQLAEMGVAIPEEFRKGMVMAGDWQVVSETPIFEETPKEAGVVKKEEGRDEKPAALNIGVRKRPLDAEEEEVTARKRWEPPTQTYPKDQDEDLDALLASTTASKRKSMVPLNPSADSNGSAKVESPPYIKRETSSDGVSAKDMPSAGVKEEEDEPGAGIVFKKRKGKGARTLA